MTIVSTFLLSLRSAEIIASGNPFTDVIGGIDLIFVPVSASAGKEFQIKVSTEKQDSQKNQVINSKGFHIGAL